MFRSLAGCGGMGVAIALIGFTELVPLGHLQSRGEMVPAQDKIVEGKLTFANIHQILARTVSLEQGMDAGPLHDALDWFRARHDLTILVDQNSFAADLNMPDVLNQQVKLPKMVKVRLDTVLDRLVLLVQGGYLVKSDHILITSLHRIGREGWGNIESQIETFGRPRPMMPLVHAVFDQRPLANVLQDLSEATGTSVVLDGRRIGDKAQATVTGHFKNVPLDTAVRLLANQAGLQGIVVDNTLLVTTEAQAAQTLQEQEKRADADSGAVPGAGSAALLHKLQQPIHLNLKEVPFHKVLQDLSKEGDLQLLLDPRLAREGLTPITVQLKEVSLDTALRLMAEMAGAKPVLVGNVVFVTSDAVGTRLQNDLQRGMNLGADGGLTGIGGGLGGMVGLSGTGAAGLAGAGNLGIGLLGLGGGLGGTPWGGGFGLTGGLLPGAGASKVISNVPLAPREKHSDNSPKSPQKSGASEKRPASKISQMHNALARKINLEQGLDATSLKEALEYLQDKTEVLFLVDNDAFKRDLNIPEPENQKVKLPKMTGVRLSTVLEQLCSQLDGNYLVRPDYISITSKPQWYAHIWGRDTGLEDVPGTKPPLIHAVNAGFDHRPLESALAELAELSGISIVIDYRRRGEQAKAPVTARFTNAPLETAVRLMADQAGLQMTVLDNVLYITTGENARAISAEHEKANRGGLVNSLASPGAGS